MEVRTKVGLRTAGTNVPPQPTITQPSGVFKAPMQVPAIPIARRRMEELEIIADGEVERFEGDDA